MVLSRGGRLSDPSFYRHPLVMEWAIDDSSEDKVRVLMRKLLPQCR